ncbi:hypothetical protein C8239_18230 [Paracidovorax avenae]|nr:hypothetical protein C8239_18230 [Paracidovorax avenae]
MRLQGRLRLRGRHRARRQLRLEVAIDVRQSRLGELRGQRIGAAAQVIELVDRTLQGAVVDAAHAGAVEGHHALRRTLVQQVEDRRQMPAQAVARDAECLAAAQQCRIALQLRVPSLHVRDLAPGETGLLDLQDVRRLVVAGGGVDELR